MLNRKKNRLALVMILALAMIFTLMPATTVFAASTWDGTIPSANTSYTFSGGAGTSSNPYQIDTAADLAQLAANVNAGTTYGGIYFVLTDDIDLNNQEWVPIGGRCAENSSYVPTGSSFQGVFNGYDGTSFHSITNLNITATATGGIAAYGLFGYVNGGTIGNMDVSGSISLSGTVEYIGGVVGYTNGSVYNCKGNVNITANGASNVGGIAGAIESTATSASVIKIQYCSNEGNISGLKRVGGIVGGVYCKYAGNAQIDQCYNTGSLTTTNSSSKAYMGGIAAYCRGYISNCYNWGNMTSAGGHYMAGIVGLLQGSNPQASLSNSYSVANFTNYSTGYDRFLFGSADNSNTLPITNCFWKATNTSMSQPTATGSNGWGAWTNVSVKTEAELTNTAMLSSLGTAFTQSTGTYPVLGCQVTRPIVTLSSGTPTDPTTVDTDEPDAVFLNGTAASNGDGTKDSPFNNFASAAEAVTNAGTPIIYIRGQVTISDAQTWQLQDAYVMRSSLYTGYLAEIESGGVLTLSGITIDGNRDNMPSSSESLINVNGGTLSVGTDAVLQNNKANAGGAVRVIDGTVTMTGGEISGNSALTQGGGVAVLSTSSTSYGTFTILGGTITRNTASLYGGGVSRNNYGVFNNSGGSITNNTPDNTHL